MTPPIRPIGRRRALAVIAGAAAAALVPGRAEAARARFEWQGTALGADARIVLYHPDRARAEAAVAACLAEIERLEQEFSLYRPDSALARLNRDGRLAAPSHDMRLLLAEARRFAEISGGAFDATVQPLWRLYAQHFAADPPPEHGPDAQVVASALALVDYRRVEAGAATVRLGSGMAVTLNGIAQGYITDRVADLLRRHGWNSVLVDLGEIRVLDGHPDGRPWMIGVRGSPLMLGLVDGAVATSAGDGFRFDRAGAFHHLFDPRTGGCPTRWQSVTVRAPRATTADALATTLHNLTETEAAKVLKAAAPAAAWLVGDTGRIVRLGDRTAV